MANNEEDLILKEWPKSDLYSKRASNISKVVRETDEKFALYEVESSHF